MPMASFTSSDCWVLFSIDFGKKGSNLSEIILNGDRINHAIFERDELETGINKLACGGFIVYDKGRFLPTQKAKSFYKKHKRAGEGYIEEWIRISEIFIKEPLLDYRITIELSEDEYKNAVKRHIDFFNKLD
jgi:hypothetical protein